MRPSRLLGSLVFPAFLAFLVFPIALTACIGGEPTPTPTSLASPRATASTKPAVKIVTDIGIAPLVTGTPTTPTPTPTQVFPTSTPLPLARLELLSQSSYKDAAGGIWVVGEARNTGTDTATDIQITLSLLGADGKVAVVSYATTHLSEVPAGGKTPFRGLFATPPQGAENVTVNLRAVPVYGDTTSDLAPALTIQDPKLSPSSADGGAIVSGQVKNGGTETAFMVRVLAVSRGADGKVTDVADGYVQSTEITPGAQGIFSLEFARAKEAPSFEAFAQGLIKARQP